MIKLKLVPKTETVAEFLARGGEVKKMGMKQPRKSSPRVIKAASIEDDVDFSFLPTALKIRYGIKV
jgi:hypothetical protein